MAKKIIVVVDMQKDFIDGALGSAEAVKIVDRCSSKIKAAKENGDTVITYVTGAGNNSSVKSFKSMSTWQVPFANGKFGKPVKLFDGSYHGGVSEDGRLAVTGSKILRANVNGKETVWYNGEQACNVFREILASVRRFSISIAPRVKNLWAIITRFMKFYLWRIVPETLFNM